MSPTTEDLCAQISSLASQLAQRSNLTETTEPRRALYDLTSALDALRGPVDALVTHAGEYTHDTTGAELSAPSVTMKQTVHALHVLLGRL
ncbi:hypothetical protein [Streptomyces sp. NPDC051572]|uniref:hypothetical protein n=1 Tax=Streptomyces sp. NPDC051572 TaxID=3155802 RepID=UPI00344FBD46